MMLAQAFLGYQAAWSVAIFTVALTLNGAVTAGYLGNGLDIAPNFSGTIFGMANTLSSLGGFLSAFMVGSLTYENQTYEQWQIVFFILSATYAFGALVYLLLGTGELQPWNDPDCCKAFSKINLQDQHLEEALPLQKKKSISRDIESA
uniref:Putative product n=1 Tax=Xenopsylla cheopis TaxID=163159 RepID=A0A6M2DW79_XENCH